MTKKKISFIEQIYRDNHEGFLRFLTQKCKSREEAQDVLQESFQKLINHENLETMENPRAYLYRTAINVIIDQQRRKHHQLKYAHETFASNDASRPEGSSVITPERQVAAKQDLKEVYRKLDELPDKCKKAFIMHRKNQLKYSEISEILEVSVSMVEKYIIRALKHLRKK